MARRKNWSAEQIIAKLRQIEVQLAQGKSIALACKEAEISEQSSRRLLKRRATERSFASEKELVSAMRFIGLCVSEFRGPKAASGAVL